MLVAWVKGERDEEEAELVEAHMGEERGRRFERKKEAGDEQWVLGF